jgi:tetrapyrrole methylase family protein / MazG family protein
MPARKTKPKRTKPRSSRQPFVAPSRTGADFQKLAAVMARLRAPKGCPWDREQTHSTLRTYLIEEAYEVLDAMDSADDAKFAEELGDLLLQVLFHAQIANEEGRFDITDVIREIYEKMIRRHPHVFGQKRARNAAEVLRNWEKIKAEERKAKQAKDAKAPKELPSSDSPSPESLLDGVPRTLPALLEACQLTRKAARIGFDWDSIDGIFEKLEEEIAELREVLRKTPPDPSRVEGELGDLLFVGVNLARFLQLDPEIALKKSSAKFSRRFHQMERLARQQGTTLAQVPRGQMESLWDKAKLNDKPGSA